MKVLITGGAGFVGSNLAAHLLEKHAEVAVFDSLARYGAAENLAWLHSIPTNAAPLDFTHGDIRNSFDVDQLIRRVRPDVIFHLAGQVAMTTSMQSPRRDFEINVVGSINVLESVRLSSPDTAIVYASSNKVYGDLAHLDLIEAPTRYQPRAYVPGGSGPASGGVDEQTGIEFHTPYGCSKGAADQYMLDYARCFGLRTVVFRHSTIYGGRQFATFDQGWVGWFVRQALETLHSPQRPAFTVSGDGKQVRDLLHVSDAVACYLAAYEHIEKTHGEALNIGGGVENSMSLLELLNHLEDRLGVKLNFTKRPWRSNDQKYFVADNSKALRLSAWSPKTSREQGIEDTIAWESSRISKR
jgi:CDP-paratose 2-epimerase